jgi:glycine cleavage system H protein
MEEFIYQNLFSTKGAEYIVVILFLIVLIPFWLFLNRRVNVSNVSIPKPGFINPTVLKIPGGLFFTKFHTWAFLERTGEALIGTDDFVAHATGDTVFYALKREGEAVKKGEIFAQLEKSGKKLLLRSPLSGEIKSVNHTLGNDKIKLTKSPYLKGWMMRIHPLKWKEETRQSYLGSEAVEWTKNEIARLRDFMANAQTGTIHPLPQFVLQDGGELIDHPISELPSEVWNKFQDEFLS